MGLYDFESHKSGTEEIDKKYVFKDMVDDRKFIPAWGLIIYLLFVHIGSFYGLYLTFTSALFYTIIFSLVCDAFGSFGVTAGAHRLWAHKAYKATQPLRIILMILNTLLYQGTIIHWVRDHRTHHKNTDTPADPHNANYGFMYSHIGWLIRKKSPIVVKEGAKIDLSDLYEDPVLKFQEKYRTTFVPFVGIVLPTIIPIYFWGESLNNAFFLNILRYTISLHFTLCINSLAHLIGGKPYDQKILPRENRFCSFITSGEGFHNYHHTFPWDYKAAEHSGHILNPTTTFIDFFAKIGWAYDLKTTSQEMIKKRTARTGYANHIWGWDDKDLTKDDTEGAIIKNKKI
ncbi:hypothetical protein WA026_009205 [Henosepilachna vigintioctopunctata]|uniref:Fatty acid desaturase domain-containing protein n=1 Tax=Henosepilachna vigintioctopunctata TaxID=420089 RepID=A0AAW1UWT7_9CUCU